MKKSFYHFSKSITIITKIIITIITAIIATIITTIIITITTIIITIITIIIAIMVTFLFSPPQNNFSPVVLQKVTEELRFDLYDETRIDLLQVTHVKNINRLSL